MATFREIDERIMNLVDSETGELLDAEAFEALQMERTEKAENMALWALQLEADAECIKGEVTRLQARQRAAERKAKSLREYLGAVLGGEKLKTPLVTISYRTSKSVEVTDGDALTLWAQMEGHDDCLTYKAPEIKKTEVKALIEQGIEVPGAEIVTRTSTQIK